MPSSQRYYHELSPNGKGDREWLAHEAALFLRDLHGNAEGCFVRFLSLAMGRTFNQYVPAHEAAAVGREKVGEVDQYVGLNPLRYPKGPMAGIRALYTDLD